MSDANEDEREETADDGAADPLAPLIEALLAAAGLPTAEVARRVREALPSAIAEIAESNRRLRDTGQRRDALVAAAAEELRAAAEIVEVGANGSRADEAARLLRLADDLERSAIAPSEPTVARRPPAHAGQRARVLVTDDDADAREAL